ncbi:AMP-binding protein [Pseudomonas aeruginosa]|nr:AMP-binding protein [Pseudomonas aeruginosa]RTT41749.1 AMP-binding protein [Pseudomonas aeruginosa]RTT45077.1 AMP-binding protein [Pseudomonas aeruginosa]
MDSFFRKKAIARMSQNSLLDLYAHPTVVARFSEMAAIHPHREAIRDRFGSVDYRQLLDSAEQLSDYLLEHYPQPGVCLGVYGEYSRESITCLLAILLSGHHYLYIDLKQPAAWNAELCRQVDCRLILDCSTTPTPANGLPCVPVRHLPAAPAPVARPCFAADQIAYINFSSGTTGRPKAIACTHAGITRLCLGQSFLAFAPQMRFLVNSPLSFDAATLEIWGALLNGGCCVLNDLGPLDPGVLRQLIGERGADSAWLTASLFNTLVDLDPDCLGGLRQLLTGGDILSVPHVRRALLRHPRLHLVNGYGPTENTTFTCCHVVTDDDLEEDDIPIGKAIAGTAVLLLDEHGQEIAEPDRAGEIVAFGAGLAQGYRNDAARTRASFVELPYRGRLLRAYRTGDRARYDEQGRLRFIGRGDGQVKLNGYRLDLPALEQRFRRQPGILDCALLVRERNGIKQLLCAWTGKADASPQALLRQLPTWQRPHACVRVEALPLTAHGKLDRAALLRRLEEPLERCASALDPDQRGCAQLWSELLGCEVGAADQDFFLCGGNSLLALQLVALCQSAGAGANLGLADLQANSRLDQFSRLLRSHGLAPERLLERAATPEQPLVLSRSAA